jgi:hypothetical protein
MQTEIFGPKGIQIPAIESLFQFCAIISKTLKREEEEACRGFRNLY